MHPHSGSKPLSSWTWAAFPIPHETTFQTALNVLKHPLLVPNAFSDGTREGQFHAPFSATIGFGGTSKSPLLRLEGGSAFMASSQNFFPTRVPALRPLGAHKSRVKT